MLGKNKGLSLRVWVACACNLSTGRKKDTVIRWTEKETEVRRQTTRETNPVRV